LVEHQRAPLVPHFGDVKAAAMTHGALACSISGAGPAIFALCKERLEAEGVAAAMAGVYEKNKRQARSFVAGINREGAALK
jgi:homoserine kinase